MKIIKEKITFNKNNFKKDKKEFKPKGNKFNNNFKQTKFKKNINPKLKKIVNKSSVIMPSFVSRDEENNTFIHSSGEIRTPRNLHESLILVNKQIKHIMSELNNTDSAQQDYDALRKPLLLEELNILNQHKELIEKRIDLSNKVKANTSTYTFTAKRKDNHPTPNESKFIYKVFNSHSTIKLTKLFIKNKTYLLNIVLPLVSQTTAIDIVGLGKYRLFTSVRPDINDSSKKILGITLTTNSKTPFNAPDRIELMAIVKSKEIKGE